MTDWPSLIILIIIQCVGLFAAVHAIMHKTDPRSATGWAGLIFFVPGIGALLYWWLGINRVHTRAKRIFKNKITSEIFSDRHRYCSRLDKNVEERIPIYIAKFIPFMDRVAGKELHKGNTINILVNGDQAYPAMLDQINRAKCSIALCSYIFDNDKTGRQFAQALNAASDRGVVVRILIDDIGAKYSFPSIIHHLKGKNLKVNKFLKSFLPWKINYAQLRLHRKLLIVDGHVAFIGGLNIREGHILADTPTDKAISDLHFKVEGLVVADLMQVFAADWKFSSHEILQGTKWFPTLREEGNALIRTVVDGPDEDFDKLRWTLLGALATANESVSIVTPYFIPDQSLLAALELASLRGVHVNIILPQKNNLRLVHWAAMSQLSQVLAKGCHIYFTPPPFDHSKIMIVDNMWSLVGSANWDARSLMLNFELNIECIDQNLATKLAEIIQQKMQVASKLSLEDLHSRAFVLRLRDSCARLISPYL